MLEVELPGDPRGDMTGTRYSSVQKLDPVHLETLAIIRGNSGKTVRAQQDRSMVYAFFVQTVTARGVTHADG